MERAVSILAFLAGATMHAEMPSVQQVSARMAETRARTTSRLRAYTVLRRYTLRAARGQSAEMMVRMTYTWPGRKKFEILSESGSNTIQKRVFQRLLDAEEDASRRDARLTSSNYDFQAVGTEVVEGRPCYVLRLTPRASRKYLIQGRAWVDAADFAVLRVEGEPLETGSFWVKSTQVVQTYRDIGGFWLPARVESESEVRIFGRAHLTIESLDYKLTYFETEDQAGLLSKRPDLELPNIP
jgi:hypothetical protein